MKKLLELYRYRELLWNLTASELKLRYRRSVLGFFWSMLNPLLMMLVLTLVFSTVMRFDMKDYAILLLSGLLPWTFLSQSVSLSLMSIVGKGQLLKKVYIPKMIIPLSAVLAMLMGHPVRWAWLFVPVSMLLLAVFTVGLAFMFSCLNVFFRDFGHMTEVLLQAWFYASPIIYTLEMVPERYRAAFAWNPVLYLVQCFREPLLNGRVPGAETVGLAAMAAGVMCLGGFLIFTRFERHFVMKV